jgi:biopolymer transport protein ExbD
MAQISGGDDGHDRPLAEINVTPLVDVMLVLLLIFILAAPLFAQALRVELPPAAAPATTDPEIITLALYSDGHLELDGAAVARVALAVALAQRLAGRPKAVLRLAADGAVSYREVAEVLSLAREGGVQQLALATRPP